MPDEPHTQKLEEPENLEQLLAHIAESSHDHEKVSLESVIEAVGRRSFGPLLLMVGLVVMSPLSGIPGLPTTLALVVLLITVQLLLGRRYFWLPTWLSKRSIPRHRLTSAVNWLAPPARFIDRVIGPHWTFLVHASGTYAIAIICSAIALLIPALEGVPFLSSVAGVALTLFGLSLVAYDGRLALVAMIVAVGMVTLAIYGLLF